MNKFKFTYEIVVEAENSEQAFHDLEDGLQGGEYREVLSADGWSMRMLKELPVIKERIASIVEKDQYTNEKHTFSVAVHRDHNSNWIFQFFPDNNMFVEANWQLFCISAKRMADWLDTIDDLEWEKNHCTEDYGDQ